MRSSAADFMGLFQCMAEILWARVYCLSGTISCWESDGPTPFSFLPSPLPFFPSLFSPHLPEYHNVARAVFKLVLFLPQSLSEESVGTHCYTCL